MSSISIHLINPTSSLEPSMAYRVRKLRKARAYEDCLRSGLGLCVPLILLTETAGHFFAMWFFLKVNGCTFDTNFYLSVDPWLASHFDLTCKILDKLESYWRTSAKFLQTHHHIGGKFVNFQKLEQGWWIGIPFGQTATWSQQLD